MFRGLTGTERRSTIPDALVTTGQPSSLDNQVPIRQLRATQVAQQLQLGAHQATPTLTSEKHMSHAANHATPESDLRWPAGISRIATELRALGYGGDLRPALLTYLAMTSRVLATDTGSLPVHLLLLGSASSGKTYTVKLVKKLMPPGAYAEIDAGSARSFIYTDRDYEHRCLILAEADSIPSAGAPAALSALRSLLAEGRLQYETTVRTSDGTFATQRVDKAGPTVLVTTSTEPLEGQLMSRMLTVELSESPEQVRLKLAAQRSLQDQADREPDQALVDIQEALQVGALWRVHVPYADGLQKGLLTTMTSTKVLRDYQKVLALVKSVALVCRDHRQQDTNGRLIAEAADYETVYSLASRYFAAQGAEVPSKVRSVVEAVQRLNDKGKYPDGREVAGEAGILEQNCYRYIGTALDRGWLHDRNLGGRSKQLEVLDPLPGGGTLPTPEDVLTFSRHQGEQRSHASPERPGSHAPTPDDSPTPPGRSGVQRIRKALFSRIRGVAA